MLAVSVTAWLLLAVVTLLLAWEFTMIGLKRYNDTISWTLYDLTAQWPPLLFLIGLVTGALVGHIWWPL